MERRRHKRARCSGGASYRLTDGHVSVGEYKNISEGGILLMVSADVARDDVLDLEFQLGPSGEPIKTSGRVVHVTKGPSSPGAAALAGVAFLDLSEENRAKIGKKIWEELLNECTRFVKDI